MPSRLCCWGCGWSAFGNFDTCCNRCQGPEGPHAEDCKVKNTYLGGEAPEVVDLSGVQVPRDMPPWDIRTAAPPRARNADAGAVAGAAAAAGSGATASPPPVAPKWAADLGFEASHIGMLRAYYRSHMAASQMPDCVTPVPEWHVHDEAAWDCLRVTMDARVADQETARGYGGNMWLVDEAGTKRRVLHAQRGAELKFIVRGHVWNNAGDTCVQQQILCLDASIVGIVFAGVPTERAGVNKTISVRVPNAPGLYMFWSSMHLEYRVRDATRKWEEAYTAVPLGKDCAYPQKFMGWLVVE